MSDESASATPAAPDASSAPSADPSGQPPQGAAPAASGADQPFYSGFEDETVRTWAEGKGLKSAEQAVKSYMNAEKLIGVPADQMLRIPKDGDLEGQQAFYAKLGKPAEASSYELTLPEGAEKTPEIEQFQEHMRGVFHKANLTPEQVKVLSEGYNEFAEMESGDLSEAYETSVQAQKLSLQQEWGQGYDRMMRLGERAVEQLGLSSEVIDGIESAVGYAETIKLMAGLGKRMLEDNFVSGDSRGTGFGTELTPAEARQAYDDFISDPQNVAALMDETNLGHAAAMRKKAEFFQLMHPPEG